MIARTDGARDGELSRDFERDRRSVADHVRLLVALLVVLSTAGLMLGGSALMLGAATGVPPASVLAGPTLDVGDAATTANETATLDVVLSAAPSGLARYDLTVATGDDSVATIRDVEYPRRLETVDEPVVTDDGAVRIGAADTGSSVRSGATDVTLATVVVRGEAPGTTTVSVTVERMDDDSDIRISPETSVGTVRVAGPPGEPTTAGPAGAGER